MNAYKLSEIELAKTDRGIMSGGITDEQYDAIEDSGFSHEVNRRRHMENPGIVGSRIMDELGFNPWNPVLATASPRQAATDTAIATVMLEALGAGVCKLSRSGETVIFTEPVRGRHDLSGDTWAALRQIAASPLAARYEEVAA